MKIDCWLDDEVMTLLWKVTADWMMKWWRSMDKKFLKCILLTYFREAFISATNENSHINYMSDLIRNSAWWESNNNIGTQGG